VAVIRPATSFLAGMLLLVQASRAEVRAGETLRIYRDGPLPTVELGDPVPYRCAGGRQLVVRYGRLSDGSLSFARLLLPGDRRLTLPRLVSGSGSRYSDEASWQWWSKGSGGVLEQRDEEGGWRTVFDQCRS
jgi:membrane-bound inhibitor of C-type lysozyme